MSKRQLVDEAIRVEQDILKEHVGSQDQVIAAYGGLNRIEFNPNGDIHVNPIPLTLERRNALEAHLMLVYSGISRTASEIAKAQVEATKRLTRQLRLIYEQVDQAIDLLQNGTDLQAFGELLHEGWMLKQSLTEHISTPSIDQLYERARAAGAIGGKLLGAGGGGFVLLFAKPEDQPVIQERLSGFLCVPFRFEQSGSRIIFYESETWPPQRGLARPVAEAVSSSPRAGT